MYNDRTIRSLLDTIFVKGLGIHETTKYIMNNPFHHEFTALEIEYLKESCTDLLESLNEYLDITTELSNKNQPVSNT
jgi:hypothetical protein